MRELRRKVSALAPTPMPLLITGPTGTGKSLLVRDVIHPLSGRGGAFVAFDCATVPEGLLPAALFGDAARRLHRCGQRPRRRLRGGRRRHALSRRGREPHARRAEDAADGVERRPDPARRRSSEIAAHGAGRRGVQRGARAAGAAMRVFRAGPPHAAEPLARAGDPAPVGPARGPAGARSRDGRGVLRRTRGTAGRSRRSSGRPEGPSRREPSPWPSRRPRRPAPRLPVVFVVPRKAWAAMERHPWPGNVRQFEMVVADALAAAVYAGAGATLERVRPRAHHAGRAHALRPARRGARRQRPPTARGLVLDRPRSSSVAQFRRDLERAAMRALCSRRRGATSSAMAERMTGSRREARAVRLRFNKLGLSARGER